VQHCTPEQLALAALREPLPADDAAHLDSCPACRAEVASLQRAVDALAVPELAAPGASVPPPPRVWAAVAAATGIAPADTPPSQVAPSNVVPLRRRRRPVLLVAAGLVVGAVVGAGAIAIVQQRDSDEGRTVEAVALDPLADEDASGRAAVVEEDDGRRVMRVKLDAPALQGSYYEIWLIDRSVKGMFPLGVVQPGTQTVELPPDLDLTQFPLVDVSVEPLDGNPAHSGDSVARGELKS
jgi:anti-sigma-K factor RskA